MVLSQKKDFPDITLRYIFKHSFVHSKLLSYEFEGSPLFPRVTLNLGASTIKR